MYILLNDIKKNSEPSLITYDLGFISNTKNIKSYFNYSNCPSSEMPQNPNFTTIILRKISMCFFLAALKIQVNGHDLKEKLAVLFQSLKCFTTGIFNDQSHLNINFGVT